MCGCGLANNVHTAGSPFGAACQFCLHICTHTCEFVQDLARVAAEGAKQRPVTVHDDEAIPAHRKWSKGTKGRRERQHKHKTEKMPSGVWRAAVHTEGTAESLLTTADAPSSAYCTAADGAPLVRR